MLESKKQTPKHYSEAGYRIELDTTQERQYLKRDIPENQVPAGAVVRDPSDDQLYVKIDDHRYRRLLRTNGTSECIASGEPRNLNTNLAILSLPSDEAQVRDLGWQFNSIVQRAAADGREIGQDTLHALAGTSYKMRVATRKLLGDENAEETVDGNVAYNFFPAARFGDVPEGAQVIHPRFGVPYQKKGHSLVRIGSQSGVVTPFSSTDNISDDLKVSYFDPTPDFGNSRQAA